MNDLPELRRLLVIADEEFKKVCYKRVKVYGKLCDAEEERDDAEEKVWKADFIESVAQDNAETAHVSLDKAVKECIKANEELTTADEATKTAHNKRDTIRCQVEKLVKEKEKNNE